MEQEYVEPDAQPPSEAEIYEMTGDSPENTRAVGWTCTLSPTYNDDWHDDVVCRNGSDSHRPYLRDWDDFVEEWEIMESAHEYEAQLNAGG